ncbi:hypothetical protein SDC9_156930 [bioreactor metagenome]|uniref:Uncharacterized protein n=1 Tax=bioreactor metagenome TaxID=1076179 RepID=A0A645F8H8_9ZZZZ
MHFCCGISRNLHIPFQVSGCFAPFAYYFSVGCDVGCIDLAKLLNLKIRTKHDVFECYLLLVGTDARQVFVAPHHQVAQQHDVVAAVHLRIGCVAIPQFPNGSSTVLNHVTPTRIFLVGSQQISNIGTSHFAELAHEPLHTNYAGADLPVVSGNDGRHYILCHFFYILMRNQLECQRQKIGRYRIVSVVNAVRIQRMSRYLRSSLLYRKEMLVECSLYVSCQCIELSYIFGETLQRGKAFH